MNRAEASTPASVNFHFDPLCPYAWRTALWIREARNVRPINVHWRLFSLEIINRKEGVEPDYVNGFGWAALRSLAYARRKYGNEGIEKLYIALGNAQHGGSKENIRDQAVVERCAQEAGFEPGLVANALADESTIQDVLNDHEGAVKSYHAFGVPTIALENSNVGFYGPVIIDVPHGEEAGELWDHTAWMLRQPNVFELKRDRAQVELGPVLA
ncbi:MAG TPA: DsbA family protein [Ktedonobacteraceae bacterium]|jgi:predicted DsbA family dithiol-disulfide isomerase|nr:DsbA family protein [Ktedonobacteraceae bacterium]